MVNAISFPVCIIMLLIHHLFCFILFNCSGFGESRGSRGKVYLFFFFFLQVHHLICAQRCSNTLITKSFEPIKSRTAFPWGGPVLGQRESECQQHERGRLKPRWLWSPSLENRRGDPSLLPPFWRRLEAGLGFERCLRAPPTAPAVPPAQPAPCLQRQVHKWKRCHKAPLRVAVPCYLAPALAEQRDHHFGF